MRATHALNSVKARNTAGFPDYLLVVGNRGLKPQLKAEHGRTSDTTAEASEQRTSGGNPSPTTTTNTKVQIYFTQVTYELTV